MRMSGKIYLPFVNLGKRFNFILALSRKGLRLSVADLHNARCVKVDIDEGAFTRRQWSLCKKQRTNPPPSTK